MAALEHLFSRPELVIALGIVVLLLTWIARRSRLRWLPAWVLRVGLVMLAWVGLFSFTRTGSPLDVSRHALLLLDLSDSIDEEARNAAWQSAQEWQKAAENRVLGVFANSSSIVLPEASITIDSLYQKVDPRSSNLAGALQKIEAAVGSSINQLILVSDGLAEQPGQVDQLIAGQEENGLRLDAIHLRPRLADNDLAVGGILAPQLLWAGTDFDIFVPVFETSSQTQLELELLVNGDRVPISPERAGSNLYRIPIGNLPEGIVTLQVTARLMDADADASQASTDPFPANNSSYATIQVFAPPDVLFVTSDPNSSAVSQMKRLLVENEITVEAIRPDSFPTNLAQLQQFGVIFLDDLLSSQLTREQMTALQVFASDFAGGVVFLGGQNSFTLGGYQDTILEPMLPVKLEPPPRSLRQPIAFLLILDLSSSMSIRNQDEIPSIALAIEAAMRSIETLQVDDYLGVLTFSDTFQWEYPIQRLASPLEIRQAMDVVSRLEASGTTYMYQAMREGVLNMAAIPPEAPQNRHILVLSDGQSTDGTPEEFLSLVGLAPANGITLSTIALGQEADTGLMEQLGEVGKGRFYAVEDARDLPDILIAESQAARSENIQTGLTSLKTMDPGHPILSGLSREFLPELEGYNALSSKNEDGAEDILVSSSFEDPILSVWQYGLGRVLAWTTDTGAEWLGDWPDESQGQFWSQVVRYALADPSQSPAQVVVQINPDEMVVQSAIFSINGKPLNLADVSFTFIAADEKARRIDLVQQSAGVYLAEMSRPPEGAYRAVLAFRDENGSTIETAVPFSVNSPAEWMPPDPDAGEANLARWTQMTGGKLTTFEELMSQDEALLEEDDSPELLDWGWTIMLALLVLWPLEIAIRRRWLPWM